MSTKAIFNYSHTIKQKVIGEIKSGVLSIAETSRIYKISTVSIYKWIKAGIEKGRQRKYGRRFWEETAHRIEPITA
ncbi:MAG: IS630 transposase-related protein [Candidatus Marinimicrobia bacterium]|nr:IS630 transposase-related protein [Candidatus Neomarinimicrobiota bacterium]